MHFSQIQISAQIAKNPYEVHRTLWKLFPDQPDAERSFLFRADWSRRHQPLAVLMQSVDEPLEQSISGLKLLRKKSVDLKLPEGFFLRFALCANPVRFEHASRRRLVLYKEEEQLAWLQRKLINAAELKETHILSFRDLYFHKKGNSSTSGHRGKISTVTFSGILEVKNSEKLQELVCQGIGPAKAFGCGLLTLARA